MEQLNTIKSLMSTALENPKLLDTIRQDESFLDLFNEFDMRLKGGSVTSTNFSQTLLCPKCNHTLKLDVKLS